MPLPLRATAVGVAESARAVLVASAELDAAAVGALRYSLVAAEAAVIAAAVAAVELDVGVEDAAADEPHRKTRRRGRSPRVMTTRRTRSPLLERTRAASRTTSPQPSPTAPAPATTIEAARAAAELISRNL